MRYSFPYPLRVVLLALVLAALAGTFLCVLPGSALRYVGLFYGVMGGINVLLVAGLLGLRRLRASLHLPAIPARPRGVANTVRTTSYRSH